MLISVWLYCIESRFDDQSYHRAPDYHSGQDYNKRNNSDDSGESGRFIRDLILKLFIQFFLL